MRRLSRIVATLGSDDRLGAFLDDARMAGIVIGGEQMEGGLPLEDRPDVLIVRHDGDLLEAVHPAQQLGANRSVEATFDRQGSDVLVSRMRAKRDALAPGYVLAVRCTARTSDGYAAAIRQFLVHVAGEPARPVTAGDARERAAAVIRELDVRAALPAVNAWFADVRRTHEAAVAAMLAREHALSERPRERTVIQPGLFDRRALSASEHLATLEERLLAQHEREIDALERSRPLHLHCVVPAVLILWR